MSSTIRIGHASISENGTANGSAGDSTGHEVYIIDNYNISNIDPYIVLRPKSSFIASASVSACIAGCNNNNIGYSQAGRNTLYNLAKELDFDLSRVGLCNTDCSAFLTVCAIAGGARITYGTNAPTTSNMRLRFSQSGDYEVLLADKYTTMTDYLKAGDILVHENIHTVMVLENGSEAQVDPDDIESAKTLQTYNVLTTVTNISDTSATINIKTVRQLNESEEIINTKKWAYILEYKKAPNEVVTERSINDNKIILTNLAKNTCYLYRIKVKNKNTDIFCSAFKTFNTLKSDVNEISKLLNSDSNYTNALYIKIAGEYKSIVPNINKEYAR